MFAVELGTDCVLVPVCECTAFAVKPGLLSQVTLKRRFVIRPIVRGSLLNCLALLVHLSCAHCSGVMKISVCVAHECESQAVQLVARSGTPGLLSTDVGRDDGEM